ncbi:MAG: O-antigen ligase family protein [Lysobacterales bacterium]
MNSVPADRLPPLLPLALAFAATLFFMHSEGQLILLAIAVAAVLYAAARTFAARAAASPALPGEARPMPDTTATATRRPAQVDLVFPTPRSALLALAALIALFANSAFSTLPSTSLWFAWIIGLFPLGYLIGITALARGAPWHRLALAAGALFGLMAAWGVVEWLRFGGRSNGPFLDYNAFGALFYLAVPPAFLALARTSSRRARMALAAFIALCLLALFATASRGAIGILLLLLAPLLLGLRRAGTPWRAPAAMLLILVGLAYGAVRYLPENPVTREVVNLGADQSTQDRLAMWQSTLNIWRDRPLMGQGLGSYKLHYLHHRSPDERSSSGDLAHNDYLQLLAEGGPLLAALLILAGLATLMLALRLWRRLGPGHLPAERAAALDGWVMALPVLGLFLHAGVNFIFYVAPLALLAGLYLARARWAAGPVACWRLPLRASPRVVGAAYGVVASLAVGAISVDWLASQAFDANNHWLVFAERRAEPLARYRMATAFAAVRPHHVATQQALTASAIDLALADRNGPGGALWAGMALTHARDWLAASQGNPFVHATVGQLLWHFPNLAPHMAPEFPDRPEAVLGLAVDRDPANPGHRLILARFLVAQNQPTPALHVLLDGLPWTRISMTAERLADTQRLLREALKLADSTGDAAWAQDLARMVGSFDPKDPTVRRLLAGPDASIAAVPLAGVPPTPAAASVAAATASPSAP